jgi:3-oxoacyl-[acyl-carrier-protein] synthase II
MVGMDDIVITGLGCITPIGLGRQRFWQSLSNGVCGTRSIWQSEGANRVYYGAPVEGFDGKQYVTPRKSLKVMSREVQLAYAAAHMAWEDAQLDSFALDPERVGVVFGSEMIPGDLHELVPAVRACSNQGQFSPAAWGTEFAKQIFPLWMLRNLPNMPPCHIAIAIDARGPNNTIVQEEVSGLLALGEAISIMSRGDADLMLVGAMGSRTTLTRMLYHPRNLYLETDCSQVIQSHHCRPFDSQRAGIVPGEAAVVLVLEKRRHAVARQAHLYGSVRGVTSRCGPAEPELAGSSRALFQASEAAIKTAEIDRDDVACVSAQGFSHQWLDRTEVNAIQRLKLSAPVTAYSSYFGTCGAASSLLQLAACILATNSGLLLPTLGFSSSDPDCSLEICHEKSAVSKSHVIQLGFTFTGQAAAVVVDCH